MKSLKIINLIIICLIVILGISLLGLNLYKKRLLYSTDNPITETAINNNNGDNTNDKDNSLDSSGYSKGVDEDNSGKISGVITSLSPSDISIITADGEVRTFPLVPNDFFFFCRSDDDVMYEEVNKNNGMVVNTTYIVKDVNAFLSSVNVQDNVRAYYYRASPDLTYLNGIVLLDCE